MQCIAKDKGNHEAVEGLSIQQRTVANHVSSLLFKLQAKKGTEAVVVAWREKIIG